MLSQVFWVALGGATGAAARFAVGALLAGHAPLATLLVNVAGSGLLGLFVQWQAAGTAAYAVFAVGFCGAFTTMSTLALQTREVALGNSAFAGAGYAVLSLALSVAALYLGMAGARRWL